jgi:hypothetical protein
VPLVEKPCMQCSPKKNPTNSVSRKIMSTPTTNSSMYKEPIPQRHSTAVLPSAFVANTSAEISWEHSKEPQALGVQYNDIRTGIASMKAMLLQTLGELDPDMHLDNITPSTTTSTNTTPLRSVSTPNFRLQPSSSPAVSSTPPSVRAPKPRVPLAAAQSSSASAASKSKSMGVKSGKNLFQSSMTPNSKLNTSVSSNKSKLGAPPIGNTQPASIVSHSTGSLRGVSKSTAIQGFGTPKKTPLASKLYHQSTTNSLYGTPTSSRASKENRENLR